MPVYCQKLWYKRLCHKTFRRCRAWKQPTSSIVQCNHEYESHAWTFAFWILRWAASWCTWQRQHQDVLPSKQMTRLSGQGKGGRWSAFDPSEPLSNQTWLARTSHFRRDTLGKPKFWPNPNIIHHNTTLASCLTTVEGIVNILLKFGWRKRTKMKGIVVCKHLK